MSLFRRSMDDMLNFDWKRSWPAPAKINLFLHVVGRRSDGFHLLQTVFRFLDYSDELRFTPREDSRITVDNPLADVEDQEQDLTVRAARLLQEAADVDPTTVGVHIAVDKRIPVGGGLGGGSSDAATTLIALNQLWRCGLTRTELCSLGRRLGADVPILVHGRSAFADREDLNFVDVDLTAARDSEFYLVTVPDVCVSTARVFKEAHIRTFNSSVSPHEWTYDKSTCVNVLEGVTCRLYPEVAEHLTWLRQRGMEARMSGSGACCFVPFRDEMLADDALKQLPPTMRGFVARGLDVHPLADIGL